MGRGAGFPCPEERDVAAGSGHHEIIVFVIFLYGENKNRKGALACPLQVLDDLDFFL